METKALSEAAVCFVTGAWRSVSGAGAEVEGGVGLQQEEKASIVSYYI